MIPQFRKGLQIFGAIAVILTVTVTSLTLYWVTDSWPQQSGQILLPQLSDRVEVRRDAYGIPHIYASNSHDLFLAQGYIHAQDRFWQMDFWRHLGAGRLSELFGESQLKTDQFLRTLGWARIAQQEIQTLPDEFIAPLTAYTEGVNAYLQEHHSTDLSLEYGILKVMNPSYKPEPWQPEHTLTWAKVMAWDLGTNLDEEIERGVLLQTYSPEQVNELFPPYSNQAPVILPDWKIAQEDSKLMGNQLGEITSGETEVPMAAIASGLSPSFNSISEQLSALATLTGPRGGEIGSNSWVVSGAKTSTGKPLLANDPHLGIQMPSIWYEMGLHCTSKTADCPYDVTGFSFAGMVGIIIGHSERIAWGCTNVGADTMDLYIEKINPQNPNQYEVNGKWVDMEQVTETIQIAGGKTELQTVRYTRHGPLISETYSKLKPLLVPDLTSNNPDIYAIALRWTGLEPARLFTAILQLNQAQNWQDFRKAAQDFDIAAQNLVYADIDGNIGYQMPGKLPIRTKSDGRYPLPGWTDEHEWNGYIPFEQLPFTFNPPSGYIVTANNAVVDESYPYLITKDWDYGFRAQRILELLNTKKTGFDFESFREMQGDNYNLNAQKLVPILLNLPLGDSHLERIRDLLKDWDFQMGEQSSAAALFESFWTQLLTATFHDNFLADFWPNGGQRWMKVMADLVERQESFWWDNVLTPEVENRNLIFQKAFSAAVAELENRLGKNPQGWEWGDLHQATFRNQSLGQSGIAPIEAIFNRGGVAIAGGNAIVNATAWNARKSFEATWIPSMRMILDLSDLNASVAVTSPGQSGHAFHRHYADLIPLWRNLDYHPMVSSRPGVEANTIDTLILLPN
ncbi:penicillin acylase family protein [Laspinema olomoucense]|uniref:penicillin acylase family protein n=1 Tax=Laspinema olomoucense TaxID=3231600 RepID=UPI0021BB13D9|nr:penicillin acylase family protein [Laspinema sp. D3c]MCT7996060.1 penicillin acylase family protein [Laspinema sp. D3c]